MNKQAVPDLMELNAIRNRAAEWVCELQEDDAPQRYEEFCSWVRQSPRHIEEFLFAAAAWKALDGVGPENDAEVETAIARALKLAGDETENVVSFGAASSLTLPRFAGEGKEGEANPTFPSPAKRGRVGVGAGLRAAALAVFAITAVISWTLFHSAAIYTTAAGEQRTVRLPDGSVLYLNIDSRAQVEFSDRARDIRLSGGEALFVVAHDPSRPFRVDTGEAVIQAVGTQFNVRRRDGQMTVSVIEGRVKVIEAGKDIQSSPLLGAGEEARVAPRISGKMTIVRHSAPEIADAVAWRDRKLVFRGDTLGHIAEEVNRYSPERRLIVEGDAARSRRFAGTFSADDPQALVRFLEQYEDLSVVATSNEIVIRMRSGADAPDRLPESSQEGAGFRQPASVD